MLADNLYSRTSMKKFPRLIWYSSSFLQSIAFAKSRPLSLRWTRIAYISLCCCRVALLNCMEGYWLVIWWHGEDSVAFGSSHYLLCNLECGAQWLESGDGLPRAALNVDLLYIDLYLFCRVAGVSFEFQCHWWWSQVTLLLSSFLKMT